MFPIILGLSFPIYFVVFGMLSHSWQGGLLAAVIICGLLRWGQLRYQRR